MPLFLAVVEDLFTLIVVDFSNQSAYCHVFLFYVYMAGYCLLWQA